MSQKYGCRFHWFGWLSVFLLMAHSASLFADERTYMIDDFTGLNVRVSDPEAVETDVIDSNLRITFSCAVNKVRSVYLPIKYGVRDQKLRLTFSKVEHVPFMGKYKTDESGAIFPNVWEGNYLPYQKGPVLFSLDTGHNENLVLWFKCDRSTPELTGMVEIEKIEIIPLEFVDDRDFVYILACLLLILFLLPGLLAYSVFFRSDNKETLLALVTPLSIASFLVLYVALLVSQAWSFASDATSLLASYIGLNTVLMVWLWRTKRVATLFTNVQLIRIELLAVIIVMLGVAAILTKGHDVPLHTFSHHRFRYLTYGAFGAIDTMFQFVNGVAIFHNEPFSKYYSDLRLLYEVQDRGVLAGVLYAVMRGIYAAVDSSIGFSYGLYTVFGSVLNVLFLLPLFALNKYFSKGPARPLLLLFLISASPYIVTNYLLTWFKMAGAGLVVSGIVLLLLDKHRIRAWAATGVLWGLASSFHPSLALSFPVVTIWLIVRFWRSSDCRILPTLGAFAALVSIFVAINMPWTLIKAANYKDTNRLFREHFLGAEPYDTEGGIAGTIGNFLDRYTLEEQLSRRYQRAVDFLRIKEVERLIEKASTEKWERVLIDWNLHEAAYALYVWLFLVALFLLSRVLTLAFPSTTWPSPAIANTVDFRWLMVTQVVSIVLVHSLTFGFRSDLTWNLPLSALAIVLYQLIKANLAVGKIGAVLIIVYAGFMHYRLFFQYF